MISEYDNVTVLNDDLLIPKTWKCSHCGHENRVEEKASLIAIKHKKYSQRCKKCGWPHIWFMFLSEEFVAKLIKFLPEGNEEDEDG